MDKLEKNALNAYTILKGLSISMLLYSEYFINLWFTLLY